MGGKPDTSAADAAQRRLDEQYAKAQAEKVMNRDESYGKSLDMLRASQGPNWNPDLPSSTALEPANPKPHPRFPFL